MAVPAHDERDFEFATEFARDSRDDRIAPSRGTLLRLSGLYALKLGSRWIVGFGEPAWSEELGG